MAQRLLATFLTLSLLACSGGSGAGTGKTTAKTSDTKTEATSDTKTGAKMTAAPFDRATAKNPWAKAEVGDWAVYKRTMGNKVMRFEVIEAGDRTVKFTAVTIDAPDDGSIPSSFPAATGSPNVVDLADEEQRYRPPAELDAVTEVREETVEVAGRSLTVTVVKREHNGSSSEIWYNEDEVRPFVQSCFKSIRDEALQFELLDFGSAE